MYIKKNRKKNRKKTEKKTEKTDLRVIFSLYKKLI
jgi:hypothetical protein